MSEALAKKSDGLWSMIKLGLILSLYAAASCTVLAVVNNVTSPVIKMNKEKKAKEAMIQVFSDADDFASVESFSSHMEGTIKIDDLKLALVDGKISGAVVQLTGPTYETSTIMVGMRKDGTLTGMRYLENKDTPGFGQKGMEKEFYGQFTGMKTDEPFAAKKNFDAISGATITSNGIASLLNQAVKTMKACLEENANE